MDIVTGVDFEAEVLESQLPVLVDFSADWCSPCKRLEPVLDKVREKLRGKVKIVKINADDDRDLAVKYQVRGLPTMILFVGGEPKARKSGFMAEDKLVKFIEENI